MSFPATIDRIARSQKADMLQVRSKQIRAVLRLQAIITVLMALAVATLWGVHGGISALLGGLISVLASATYGVLISRVGKNSAGSALVGMMRAEAAKVLVIVSLLWLVFSAYQDISGVGFVGTFIVTTLVFSLAIFFRDT